MEKAGVAGNHGEPETSSGRSRLAYARETSFKSVGVVPALAMVLIRLVESVSRLKLCLRFCSPRTLGYELTGTPLAVKAHYSFPAQL